MTKSEIYKIQDSIQEVVTKYGITKLKLDTVLNVTNGGSISLIIEYDS